MYFDDTKLFPKRTSNLFELLKVEMKRVHQELSVTEGGEEGKSKLEVSNPHLRQRLGSSGRDQGSGWIELNTSAIDKRTSLRISKRQVKRKRNAVNVVRVCVRCVWLQWSVSGTVSVCCESHASRCVMLMLVRVCKFSRAQTFRAQRRINGWKCAPATNLDFPSAFLDERETKKKTGRGE